MLKLMKIWIELMPVYNLIEYNDNYSGSSGSLWQFIRAESPMNNAENPLQFNIF